MSHESPQNTYAQAQRQPSFAPHPQPYGQRPSPHGPPHHQGPPYPPPQNQVPYGQQPYPTQSTRPSESGARETPSSPSRRRPRRPRTRGRRIRKIAWLLIIVATIIIVTVSLTSGGGGAKYSTHVISYTAVNPADLSVAIRVTNTGAKPGTPTCTIDAQDPSFTYTGVDGARLQNPVSPGKSVVFVDNLTITKQGAGYVTQVTVSC